MRLYLLECKKIMTSRFHLLLLLLFMILPVVIFQNRITDTGKYMNPYLHEDGSRMSTKEIQAEVHREKLKWTGTMDADWWQRLTTASRAAEKRLDTHFYDMDKMNALYGDDWYEQYQKDKKAYAGENEAKEQKKGKKILYQRKEPLPNYKKDIADEVVLMLYMGYGKTMLANKPWNSEDGTFGTMYSAFNNEKVASPVYSLDVSRSELQLLKAYMNEQGSFHYGDSKEWFSLLETYSTVGIVLMVWVLVISSNLICRERKQNMLEVLSSCSRGGSSLLLSKLAAVITCAWAGLLLMVLPVTLYAWLSGNLGDMAVNITEGLHLVSIFTYQEGFLISLEVLALGAVVCAVLGVLASTCVKSSYVSLGICLLFLFAGTALSSYTSWMKLFPVKFMETTSVAVRGFTCNLFHHAFFLWKLLPLIWIPGALIIGYIALRIYRSPSYQRV
ncbi:ABC transporter permease [[Clostridium] innocuum]|nr:ABC transporter permease [[Clostridium] innocuum]